MCFFFNDTATPEIYTLSLHDALPIYGAGKTTAVRILTTLLLPDGGSARIAGLDVVRDAARVRERIGLAGQYARSEEHTPELQSRQYLVCRFLLEKKKAPTGYTLHPDI